MNQQDFEKRKEPPKTICKKCKRILVKGNVLSDDIVWYGHQYKIKCLRCDVINDVKK